MHIKWSSTRLFIPAAVLGLAICLLLPWAADELKVSSVMKQTPTLRPGMSQKEVRRVLGRPVTVIRKGTMFLNASNPETWVYGRKWELRNSISKKPPFFWPVRLRLRPCSDDVVIEFDDS